MRLESDSLWKGIIEEVFDDLLRFIWNGAADVFDMHRGFSFMDKELAELYPEAGKNSATRIADKLVKVYKRNGEEACILVHLEVQGKAAPDFPRRMFQYYYRIRDRWGHPVTAVAILTGADANRIPDRYEDDCLGTRLAYKYNVLRIGWTKEEELASSDNPFAAVLLIARKAIGQKMMTDEEMMEVKLEIVKSLMKKGFGARKVRAILDFLKLYLVFKAPENDGIFREKIDLETNKNNPMGIIEMVEHECREEGRQSAKEKFVKALLENTDFTDEKIAKLSEVSVTEVATIRKAL